MNNKTLVACLAALALAGSLYFIFYKPAPKGDLVMSDVYLALGQRAAAETLELLQGRQQVVVVGLDAGLGEGTSYEPVMKTFQQKLKQKGVRIAATTPLPGGMRGAMMGARLSAKSYFNLLDKAPDAGAVVSFAGLPAMKAAELKSFHSRHPPLVVVDVFGGASKMALAQSVAENTVALAFVQRLGTDSEKENKSSDLLAHYYEILRAAR